MTRRVAVVGSGVAGLTAAHVLSRSADVTLYEADDRLGGHADTHVVHAPEGDLAIDTGFIVHNRRTYPTLLRLFAEFGVATQPSEMSMSISDPESGVEWAGALGLRGALPSVRALRPAHLRMLAQIPRFHRAARRLLATPGDEVRLRDFAARHRFDAHFVRHYLEPLVAAVWSCDPAQALDQPARNLFTFLQHHGMLAVFGSPPWRTVSGGSREYVARVAAGLAEVRTGTKVTGVTEHAAGVDVVDGNGTVATYDAVVLATHPGQALALLTDPTPAQREVLGALPYTRHTARLHTDTSLLPRQRAAWASWNFRREPGRHDLVVTYDLTRLQRLATDTRYLVTLGGEDLVDPAAVLATMEYEHPLYTAASVAAQRRVAELDSDRLAFAGAWQGWGFHEDGARSGLRAAERLGADWAAAPVGPDAPRVYEVTIRHTRRTPFRNDFSLRSHAWLVDLDELPDHGPLARFEARDHLGEPDRSIRDNLAAFLATRDVRLGTGRALMLAVPRVLGYCFNPITVFWVRPETGAPCVVVEVHNTYGDRHAYLVHPDERGRADVDKALYVSPFHDVSGRYSLAVPTPGARVAVSVRLGDFTASLTGRRLPPGPGSVARASLGTPLAPLLGRARIHAHGLRLWARRLPVHDRPVHDPQEGVQ